MGTEQQFWRSSWSGPRGYSAWQSSSYSGSPTQDLHWFTRCNVGNGSYDYEQVAYPIINQVSNSGGKVRSQNLLKHQNCGSSS